MHIQIDANKGKSYVNMLEKAFIGKKVVNPLEGCRGNGEMMSAMVQAIQRNSSLLDK
jgi:hypothetical protein